MTRYQPDMLEFIRGKCEAMKEPKKFVHDWIHTERNPCSVCGTDKSKCAFYKELIEKGAIEKGDKQP